MRPPPPFLPSSVAWSAWGFDQPHVECVTVDDGDEVLLDLLLYAQGRKSPGPQWCIWAEFDNETGERFRVRNLCVEFEAHCECEDLPRRALMNIEYVVAAGRGLFWLELPGISAFCWSQEEVLRAIDAVVPFVPQTIYFFFDQVDRLALEVHLWQCIHLSGGDKVREAAVRRKMRMMGFFVL